MALEVGHSEGAPCSGAANSTGGQLSLASRTEGLVVEVSFHLQGESSKGREERSCQLTEPLIYTRTLPAMCQIYSRYSMNKVLNDWTNGWTAGEKTKISDTLINCSDFDSYGSDIVI